MIVCNCVRTEIGKGRSSIAGNCHNKGRIGLRVQRVSCLNGCDSVVSRTRAIFRETGGSR